MNKSSLLTLAAALVCIFPCTGLRAQEKDPPKLEVGVHFTSLETTETDTQPGFGGRITYNRTDNIAFEGEGNFLPQRHFFGRTTQGQFGVKVGKRFEKFGVFGKVRPGFVSYSEVFRTVVLQNSGSTFPTVDFRVERQTHFSTDVGGVLEFYPSRRILARFDAGDTIIRYGAFDEPDFSRFPVVTTVRRPVEIRHNFQLSAGVAFRFMDSSPAASDAQAPVARKRRAPRYEVGVQYTSLSINRPTEFPADVIIGEPADFTEPAVGGRFTFNLTDSLALEAAMDFFTKENFFSPSFGATFGGYGMSGQFGVKAGKRFERFGLFGKARPGFVSYSRVYHLEAARDFTFFGQQFTLGEFSIGRKYYFSTDLGGVLEFYPSRRLVTRFDLGDTIIRYRDRASQGFSLSSSIIRQPDETRHNFQFTAGLGFRF